jgi:hypothetical protein
MASGRCRRVAIMVKRPLLNATLVTLLATAGCGRGDAGDALLSTTLTGQFNGQAFTPAFGVATIYKGSNVIALGDGAITCGSVQQNDTPMGTNAKFSVPTLDVGTYSSVSVYMSQYEGRTFDLVGSSDATVTLTAVSMSSVVGTITYGYTDSAGGTYSLAGSFEVTRCQM